MPVSVLQIRSETRDDSVIRYLKSNWPKQISERLKQFQGRKDELAFDNKVLFWAHSTIIPNSLTEFLLKEFYSIHLGTVKIKSIAKSYFWWPTYIEKFAKNKIVVFRE